MVKGRPTNNKILYNEELISFTELSKIVGVDRQTLSIRRKLGWTDKEIIEDKCKEDRQFISFEYLKIPTEYDKAYIAGYFDGEGCLTVAKRPFLKEYRPDFTVEEIKCLANKLSIEKNRSL